MANRVRNKQIIVRVTEEERALIDLKMSQLPTSRLGAYMRKMAIDGYIILLDVPEIKKHTAELSAIGRNINIIAKRICQNAIYEQDIKDLKQFYEIVRKYAGIKELTPTIVNEFIKKIIAHAPDKSSGHRVQKIQIVFNFIGEFAPQNEFIPDKREIPQDYF